MLKRKENIIVEKTKAFADRIGRMCVFVQKQRKANSDVIRQVNRSGTSIGANIAEGIYAQSNPDFISKFSIALKEANETKYWLERLHASGSLNEKEFDSILHDNQEIIYILISIIKTMKEKNYQKDGTAITDNNKDANVSNENANVSNENANVSNENANVSNENGNHNF